MKTNLKWLVLSGILVCYAVLYMASSGWNEGGALPACDEVCDKVQRIDTLIRRNYNPVSVYVCQTDKICVYVSDTLANPWQGLADTTCLYLHNEGLHNYKVNIINYPSLDTLLKQACP